MKKLLAFAALTFIGGLPLLSAPAHAEEEVAKTAVYGYDTYTCDDLVDLDYERVGSVIYYIRGHYDAAHDIWTDYSPDDETTVEDDLYIPVEDVYGYCMKNPKSTVVEALTTYND